MKHLWKQLWIIFVNCLPMCTTHRLGIQNSGPMVPESSHAADMAKRSPERPLASTATGFLERNSSRTASFALNMSSSTPRVNASSSASAPPSSSAGGEKMAAANLPERIRSHLRALSVLVKFDERAAQADPLEYAGGVGVVALGVGGAIWCVPTFHRSVFCHQLRRECACAACAQCVLGLQDDLRPIGHVHAERGPRPAPCGRAAVRYHWRMRKRQTAISSRGFETLHGSELCPGVCCQSRAVRAWPHLARG